MLEFLASSVISVVETTRYAGVAFLMALESANIPIPSEIIMPFAGYLVSQGELRFWLVVFWGAVGNLIGSLVSYYLGFFGGRPFLSRFGKFFFMKNSDLDFADGFFKKHGSFAIFLARLLPIVRTFISFPAGVSRMNIWKFSLYTMAGSLIWSFFLTFIGVKAGENWKLLEPLFKKFDWLIAFILLLCLVWWILRHILNNQEKEKNE